MTENDDTPRVWIGSLAAYNAGSLIGAWFDAADAPTNSEEWVDAMIERGEVTSWAQLDDEHKKMLAHHHEEIWVFDHENFGGWLTGECSPMTAQQIAEKIDELGDDAEAFGLWCKAVGNDPLDTEVSDFQDHYQGHAGSFREWVLSMDRDDPMLQEPDDVPHYMPERHLVEQIKFLLRHFDWDGFIREMEMGHTVVDAPGGGVYIFND